VATDASGANPPEQRPAVSAATAPGAAHNRAARDGGAVAQPLGGGDVRRVSGAMDLTPMDCALFPPPMPAASWGASRVGHSRAHGARRNAGFNRRAAHVAFFAALAQTSGTLRMRYAVMH